MSPKSGTLDGIRWTIASIALLGLVVMAYLFSLRFSTTGSAFCNLGENLSCDVVNKSVYATVFGIPISALGFLYFLGVAAAVIWKWKPSTARTIAVLTIIFLGPSLYLSGIESLVLKNVCVLCEGSKVLMVVLLVFSLKSMGSLKLSTKAVWTAILISIFSAFITYAVQSRTVPDEKYSEFAQCLTKKGFVMYGSLTCSYCAVQRAMFGASFEKIREIECHPRNPNPQTQLCVSKDIKGTPTWIQEDENGEDVYRFPAGVVSLEDLSRVSNCPLPQR